MTTFTGSISSLTAGTTTLAAPVNNHRDALKAVSEAWTSYAPTLTNLTIGNGSTTAAYARVTKLIHLRIRIAFGSTTAIGGAVSISLPVQAVGTSQIIQDFIGSSGGTVLFAGTGFISASSTTVQPYHPTSTSNTSQVSLGSVGLTMGTGSYVMLQGTYEAA